MLGSPSGFTYQIGGAGTGVTQAGTGTSGSSGNASTGYMKIAVGTITGYTGGTVTFPTDPVIESGSQTTTSFDVDIFSGGAGTGTAGFKLPTTQVPTIVFKGGGLGDPPTSPQVHATATATVSGNKVSAVTLNTDGNGYTEIPYVYILNGAGTQQKFSSVQIDATSKIVSSLTLDTASSVVPTKYLKFGGTVAADRWVIITATDTTNCNYFSIKACRGNGINGGDVPEENLTVEYQLGGTTTWNMIDTIINPNAARTDPLIGTVPKVTANDATWDGASGDTKWYTYSVAFPAAGRGANTKIRLKQVRATGGDNAGNTDHYGICEFTFHNQKTSNYVFIPDPGAISKPLVDSLDYTVHGESGSAFTYTSGLGCGDATMTLKSTTKIEPVANIDPDYGIPLVHPYQHCKYLIKAF